MIITGIGSRKTPRDILSEMTRIGKWIYDHNYCLRSGHADGADWAFEQGAQDACIAYIPWHGFNRHLLSRAALVVPEFTKEHFELVNQYHPAPGRLSPGARKLMARNGCQILGADLLIRSNVVVCWTPGGVISGGTGQAMRMAGDFGISVVNMYRHQTLEAVLSQFRQLNLL